MCVLVAQLGPTLCNPVDYIPSGSSVHGISQARILEWVVVSFSRGSSQCRQAGPLECRTEKSTEKEFPGLEVNAVLGQGAGDSPAGRLEGKELWAVWELVLQGLMRQLTPRRGNSASKWPLLAVT